MTNRWRARGGFGLAGLILISAYLVTLPRLRNYAEHDPDRYYHLAVSRLAAEQGRLRTLPQAEDLGWNRAFPEKEFLFHQLTTLAYRLGGEPAVLAVTPLLAGTLLLLLLAFAAGYAPLPLAALSVGLGTLATPDFLERISLLRPHLLAMNFFVLLLFAVVRRRPWLAAAAGALFALSYHAAYVPLGILVPAALLSRRLGADWARSATFGILGLVLGTVANPYFPANLGMGLATLDIAFAQANPHGLLFGDELIPLRADVFLKHYAFHLGILLVGASVLLAARNRHLWKNRDPLILMTSAAALWALTALSPRAIEYAVPLSAVVLAMALGAAGPGLTALRLLPAAGLLVTLPSTYEFFRYGYPPAAREKAALLAAAAIPAGDRGAKVFNCEWNLSPFLLYVRPDLRFVDLLDPSLLLRSDPAKSALRQSLLAGKAGDPYGLLRDGFGASYAFCANPAVVERLERDPRFRRLYPGKAEALPPGGASLFALSPAPDRRLADELEVAALPRRSETDYLDATPARLRNAPLTWERRKGPYVDRAASLAGAPGTVACDFFRAEAGWIRERASAELVGIGGGRNIRLWLNGEPLFTTDGAAAQPWLIQRLVPLPRPLRPADRLEAIVCSATESPYLGFALSLWKESELDAVCADRHADLADAKPGRESWKFATGPRRTCLAPLAARRL